MTCSTVTTPRSRPSASTAISAPRRRSGSEPSSASSGASAATRRPRGGELAHRGGPPSRSADVLDRGAVREPDEAAVVLDHGEPVPALVAEEELVVRLRGRQPGGDRHRLGVHDVGDRDALELLGERGLRQRAARGGGQQPAQRGEPQAVEHRVAEDREGEAAADQDPAEPDADVGGEARGLVPVAGDLPGGRAGDPAAVERERRHEVEHEQHEVHRDEQRDDDLGRRRVALRREPRRVPERVRAGEQHRRAGATAISSSVTSGPGRGDAELRARRVGLAAHLHHAAEQEEVDALDLDPLAPGGQRVPELVQHDRAEERRPRTTATT